MKLFESKAETVATDPEVIRATAERAEAAHLVAEKQARVDDLRHTIDPPARRVEIETPVTHNFQGRKITGVHVDSRIEHPVVDPIAARRARLQLPAAELDVLEAEDALKRAEDRVRIARERARERLRAISDERVKNEVAALYRELLPAVARMDRMVNEVIPEENARLGPGALGQVEYPPTEFVFAPLIGERAIELAGLLVPPREGLFDIWVRHMRERGWL
jgi:hypothetical protein